MELGGLWFLFPVLWSRLWCASRVPSTNVMRYCCCRDDGRFFQVRFFSFFVVCSAFWRAGRRENGRASAEAGGCARGRSGGRANVKAGRRTDVQASVRDGERGGGERTLRMAEGSVAKRAGGRVGWRGV